MGNCGTHSSAIDETEELKQYPDVSLTQVDHMNIDIQNKLANYGTKCSDMCKSTLHFAATDPSFDHLTNVNMLNDLTSTRSMTPVSGFRPKSYIKYPSLDGSGLNGSSSPTTYGSENRAHLEQRPNSASHLLRYSLNNGNYSPNANSYVPSIDQRSSPTIKQMQHRSSNNIEKNAQKTTPKTVQQKYLIHHSLSKNAGKYFVAIFDYRARCDEDLTVHKGDIVLMLDRRFVNFVFFNWFH